MKATLYEALGINPIASDEDVRAALRRIIRKYYAKTRDGQGNVEEALRFINHASRILSDPERRQRYDRELSISDGTTEERIEHVVSNAVAEAGEQTDVGELAEVRPNGSSEAMDEDLDTGLDIDEPAAERQFHHPGLTERVASFGRSPIATIALCAMFGAFIAAAIVFVTPDDGIVVARQVLVWLTLTLMALTLVYGGVHGIGYLRRRRAAPQPVMVPQTDLAILNWRREKSVFLGTNQPQEDASWIFQLRMAELERAKSGRTSEPRPWQRLAARIFDYAIWGLVLALLLSELRGLTMLPENLGYWLGHPLLAPILITGHLDTDRGAAHRIACDNARQVAVRRIPAVLDFRRLRAARHAGAVAACDAPRVSRLVGGCCMRLSAARAHPHRGRLRKARAEPGNRLGFCAGRAGDARAPGRAQYGHRCVRIWRRCCGCTASRGTSPWPIPLRGRAAPFPMRCPNPADLPVAAARSAAWCPAPRTRRQGRPGPRQAQPTHRVAPAARPGEPIDADVAALFAERRAKVAVVSVEGPRMLQAGNFRRAAELCRAWTELELANAESYRCLGLALQAQGYHQDAIAAFRKAKQYDPNDRSLDASIATSQKGIVAEFFDRYRK